MEREEEEEAEVEGEGETTQEGVEEEVGKGVRGVKELDRMGGGLRGPPFLCCEEGWEGADI